MPVLAGGRNLVRLVFLALTVASLLAVFVLDLELGNPESAEWWLLIPFFYAWVAGPLALPYILSAHSQGRRFTPLWFVAFLVAAMLTGWTYYDVLMSDNSTAAIELVFMPIVEWAALLVLIAVSAAFGWRPPSLSSRKSPNPGSPPPG